MSESVLNGIPGWAQELRSLFRSGAVGQFILHGNIFDLVPAPPRLRREFRWRAVEA